MFNKRELLSLSIAIFVMSLAIGFDDGQEAFEWSYFLYNFVVVTGMVAFSFLMHQIAHKVVAKAKGFKAEFSLWGIQSFRFMPVSIAQNRPGYFPKKFNILGKRFTVKTFPIGVVISILFTTLTNGAAFFLAVGQYTLFVERGSRFGKKFVEVQDYEEAQISLAGPMMHVILMVIGAIFNSYGTFDTFIFINAALALFYMIPIHNLDGTKLLFCSPLLYAFSLIFMVAIIVLVYFLPVIPLLIVAALASAIGGSLFYYFAWYKA
jgi:Zn-dependent protease